MLQPTESLNVTLPAEEISALEGMVDKINYFSHDDIILEALQMRKKMIDNELRRLWDEGEASGCAGELDMEKIISRAKKKRAERLANSV